MSRQYDDEKRGVLFRNEKKDSEKHPDYRGFMQIEGVEYRLAAWVRESAKGTKYMSLSATPPEDHAPQAELKPQRQPVTVPDDDGLPF